MMKKPIPKVESFIAFVKSKGWEIESKDEDFYILKPPVDVKPSSFRVQIPHIEHDAAYPLMITTITSSFANFYDWDERSLLKLLSQAPHVVEDALQDESLGVAMSA